MERPGKPQESDCSCPQSCCHPGCGQLLSAGEHPMWVAKQMGHADWTMIAKIYGKEMPDAAPDAGARAEAVFAPEESCDSGAKTGLKRPKQ